MLSSKKSHEECSCIDNTHTYIYGKHIHHIQVRIIYNMYIEEAHGLL